MMAVLCIPLGAQGMPATFGAPQPHNLTEPKKEHAMQTGLLGVGTIAPPWILHDNTGAGYSLPVLQAHRPAILTFLRHFG
jgi:hypothetical protein